MRECRRQIEPDRIHSQHFPEGCFITADDATLSLVGFFNEHDEAVNTEELDHRSVCRVGATVGDIDSASYCEVDTLQTSRQLSQDGCTTACVSNDDCEGMSFKNGVCSLLGSSSYTLVTDGGGDLYCAKSSSCKGVDLFAAASIVDNDACYANPRLNQLLDAQETCFDVGCTVFGALSAPFFLFFLLLLFKKYICIYILVKCCRQVTQDVGHACPLTLHKTDIFVVF